MAHERNPFVSVTVVKVPGIGKTSGRGANGQEILPGGKHGLKRPV